MSRPTQLRPYQLSAIEKLRTFMRAGAKRLLLVSPVGCHALGAGLLRHDGRIVEAQDVAVGDTLMGPDSRPRTVQSLIRGTGEMVRVVPVKGDPFTVNIDHVLTVVRTNDGSKSAGGISDVAVRDLLAWPRATQANSKLFRVAADFPPHGLPMPVDPYFLGVLLGDGNLQSTPSVCKPDPEIRAAVEDECRRRGLCISDVGRGTSASMRLSAGEANRGVHGCNSLTNDLRTLGLWDKIGCDKFIPDAYLRADRDSRMAMLAGLMDTDGSLSRGGFDFVSMSRRLSDGVAFLARSMGLAAYVAPCEKHDQNGAGGTYWRVSISGDANRIPTRIARKKAPPRLQKKDALRTGLAIEPAGIGDFYGFTLDGDGRYLMADFTVTHNSGKTTISSEIIHRTLAKTVTGRDGRPRAQRVLFLAHRNELILQCGRRLDNFGVEHGIIAATHPERYTPWLPVQVASIQTLVRRLARLDRMSDSERGWFEFDLIVIDEAHRSRAKTHESVLARYPDAVVIGMTASPWRLDGKGLGETFHEEVVAEEPRNLIAQGYLVAYDGYAFYEKTGPDMEGVHVVAGDYSADDLAAKQRDKKIMGRVIDEWMAHARDQLTIGFACNVAHSKEMAEAFRARGIASEHVDGETPDDEREAIVGPEGRFVRGVTRVLWNVGILSEGYDVPAASCVILTRATMSLTMALQQIGRVMRPVPCACGMNFDWHLAACPKCGAPPIKTRCWIHDHAGILTMHGAPDAERDWSLTADEAKRTRKAKDEGRATPLRQCLTDRNGPGCYRIFAASIDTCPGCGKAVATNTTKVREVDGVAVRIDQIEAANPAEQRKTWETYLDEARANGYRHGWVAQKFKARWRIWPPYKWTLEAKRRFERDPRWTASYAARIAGQRPGAGA